MPKTEHQQAHTAKKIAFITAILIQDPEPYKGKTNADIEREIMEETGIIPYVAKIEKVTVLDFPSLNNKNAPQTRS